VTSFTSPVFTFSPSGQSVAFTDRGPGPGGEDADQIATLDLVTATRTQITHLPPPAPGLQGVCCPEFLDDMTVGFPALVTPSGPVPGRDVVGFTVKLDNLELQLADTLAEPGSQLLQTLVITGSHPSARALAVAGTPVNDVNEFRNLITEIFLVDGRNLLQLTNFRREDTGSFFPNPVLDARRERVFFQASADPFGTNLSEDCQLFSIDRTGTDLRQLTFFREAERSQNGCLFGLRTRGCSVEVFGQDSTTGTVLFYSSCDPFGTNPNGAQIFAISPNGTGLRQLTAARGLVIDADGTVTTELPSHYAYAGG
jgi:hypothetical protein